MQVRVAGPAAENGTIEARSVIVTPENLEDPAAQTPSNRNFELSLGEREQFWLTPI